MVGLVIRLADGNAKIIGHVRDASGRPIKGALVSGFVSGPELNLQRTDEAGYFHFESVVGGNYRIRANAPGYMIEGKDIQITDNKSGSLEFNLHKCDSLVLGKVMDDDERPLRADVYLYRRGMVLMKTESRVEDGIFAFNDLVSDDYEMSAHSPCHGVKNWSGRVNAETEVRIALSPMEGCTSLRTCDVCEQSKNVIYCRFCHAYICGDCRHNYPERVKAMIRKHLLNIGKGPDSSQENYEAELNRSLSESERCGGCPS
jgi:hypothetical protein